MRACLFCLVRTAEFPRPDSVRLVTSLRYLTTTQEPPTSFPSPSLRMGEESAVRRGQMQIKQKKWREERKEEERREGGRAGQGLSVEKTAMKGNCHAPVLAQEHLSPEEHTKCAGHVLTIPPTFLHTPSHIQAERKGLMLHHWKGIACLTACQSSCRWLIRICKEKLD